MASIAAQSVGFEWHVPPPIIVANETCKHLTVTFADGAELVLAPLEEMTIDGTRARELQLLVQRRQLRIRPAPPARIWPLVIAGTMFAVLLAAYGAYAGDTMLLSAGLVGAPALAVAVLLTSVSQDIKKKQDPSTAEVMVGVLKRLEQTLEEAFHRVVDGVARTIAIGGAWLRQTLTLVAALVVGIAAPAAALYFGGDLADTIRIAWEGPGDQQERAILTLVGRTLQVFFIAIASLLPALLYFLFNREQLRTLSERFVRHIFRLDRTVETVADIKAKYGALMDEAYGARHYGSGRLLPGTRLPIVVATLVLSFGWIVTLLNPEVRIVATRENGFVSLFDPSNSAVAFGFLGAYFFAINAVVRGFVRGDLQPKAYGNITARVLIVFVLAWVLELAFTDEQHPVLLGAAFIAGIVPETALVRIRDILRARALANVSPQEGARPSSLARLIGRASEGEAGIEPERHPLTNLEGIDIYDRTRLGEEGVTNVEGLAHYDLVELMLHTRIPAPRIVDWVDQALLYLHVSDEDREELRRYGIRTGTDLDCLVEKKRRLDGDEGLQRRLRIAVEQIRKEEWFGAIRHWRATSFPERETIAFP